MTEAELSIARNTSSTAWKPGEVAFTSSISTALRRHGDSIVSAALTCMAEAFEGQCLTHGASVFGALIRIFSKPPEGFDSDRLIPALGRFDMMSLGEIVRDQKGGDARAVAVYSAIIETLTSLDQMIT